MRLLTFTTQDYRPWAERCRISFAPWATVEQHDLPRRETWIQTCLQRPELLIEAASEPFATVGLCDADMVAIRRPARLLDGLLSNDWDVMCDDRGPDARERDRMSAQLVVFRGVAGHEVLWKWAALCQKDDSPSLAIREQIYLLRAIQEQRPRIRNLHGGILVPPKSWDGVVPDGIEIIHVPASRDIEGTDYLNDRI